MSDHRSQYNQGHLERVAYEAAERASKDVAERASQETIRKTFSLLGCDVEDQESINRFRADLIHARKSRELFKCATRRIGGLILTLIVLALAGLVTDDLPTIGGLFS